MSSHNKITENVLSCLTHLLTESKLQINFIDNNNQQLLQKIVLYFTWSCHKHITNISQIQYSHIDLKFGGRHHVIGIK